MKVYEDKINGYDTERKFLMFSLYYLVAYYYPEGFKPPNYISVIQKYRSLHSSKFDFVEIMVKILTNNDLTEFTIDNMVAANDNYVNQVFKKYRIIFPKYLHCWFNIEIAFKFLTEGNRSKFKNWIDKAIVNLSGALKVQEKLKGLRRKKKKGSFNFVDFVKESLSETISRT